MHPALINRHTLKGFTKKREQKPKRQNYKLQNTTYITKSHSFELVNEKTNYINRSLNTSHTDLSWRNDSPQRSCNSLALGLPTSRGGWQGPGGTAGVWTCSVSDSLERKTTLQLRKERGKKKNTNNNKLTISPPPLFLSQTHWVQTVIFTSLSGWFRLQHIRKGDKCKCIVWEEHLLIQIDAEFLTKLLKSPAYEPYVTLCRSKRQDFSTMSHISLQALSGINSCTNGWWRY